MLYPQKNQKHIFVASKTFSKNISFLGWGRLSLWEGGRGRRGGKKGREVEEGVREEGREGDGEGMGGEGGRYVGREGDREGR